MNLESQRVLLVVAHPDDPEYLCGGTLAKWAREGKEICYLLLTSGEKGSDHPAMTPEMVSALRQAEQRSAAQVIGAKEVVFLGYRDGELANTPDVRRDIVREIRRFRPQVIVTTDPTPYILGNAHLNHMDHRTTGAATLEAAWPAAGSPKYFPELLQEGLEPCSPREVWLCLTNEPNVAVDVTGTINVKIAALLEHKSQIKESPEELAKHVKGRLRRPIWQVHRERFRVIRFC
jgi:LmbE family N-acetylglucosaminyl deacetylase